MRKKRLKSYNIEKTMALLDKILENWSKNQEWIDKEIQELEYKQQLRSQQRNEAEKHS